MKKIKGIEWPITIIAVTIFIILLTVAVMFLLPQVEGAVSGPKLEGSLKGCCFTYQTLDKTGRENFECTVPTSFDDQDNNEDGKMKMTLIATKLDYDDVLDFCQDKGVSIGREIPEREKIIFVCCQNGAQNKWAEDIWVQINELWEWPDPCPDQTYTIGPRNSIECETAYTNQGDDQKDPCEDKGYKCEIRENKYCVCLK